MRPVDTGGYRDKIAKEAKAADIYGGERSRRIQSRQGFDLGFLSFRTVRK